MQKSRLTNLFQTMWILATNLAKSKGQRSEFQGPGLLKPFLSQIWMSVGVLGLILDVSAAVFDRGFWFWRYNSISDVAGQNIHMRLLRDHQPKRKLT